MMQAHHHRSARAASKLAAAGAQLVAQALGPENLEQMSDANGYKDSIKTKLRIGTNTTPSFKVEAATHRQLGCYSYF